MWNIKPRNLEFCDIWEAMYFFSFLHCLHCPFHCPVELQPMVSGEFHSQKHSELRFMPGTVVMWRGTKTRGNNSSHLRELSREQKITGPEAVPQAEGVLGKEHFCGERIESGKLCDGPELRAGVN